MTTPSEWVTVAELNVLKPWISSAFERLLGFKDEKIAQVAIDCLARRTPISQQAEQLSMFMDDGDATRYVSQLRQRIESLRAAGGPAPTSNALPKPPPARAGAPPTASAAATPAATTTARTGPTPAAAATPVTAGGTIAPAAAAAGASSSSSSSGTPKRRLGEDEVKESDEKRVRAATLASGSAMPAVLPSAANVQAQIAAALAAAKAKSASAAATGAAVIAPADASGATIAPLAASAGMDAEAKARRVAELQARLAVQLVNLPKAGAAVSGAVVPLRLNDKGEEIDAFGQVIPKAVTSVASSMINKKKAEEAVWQKAQQEAAKAATAPSADADAPRPGFDPSLAHVAGSARRGRRDLKLLEPGHYLKKERLVQIQIEKEAEIEQAARDAELAVLAAANDAFGALTTAAAPHLRRREREPLPDVEWWDIPVLKPLADSETISYANGINEEKVTHYEEHPVIIQPSWEPPPPPPAPMMLTKKERKKMRKIDRGAALRDKRDRILLGLDPPPEPKVRISNMYRVLANQAIADPTQLERKVRQQMAERLKVHENTNAERKKTPEEKKNKKKEKLQKDAARQTVTTLFKLNNITHPLLRAKVEKSASKLLITGAVVTCGKDLTLIVAEGGAKAMRKYSHLLLKRIDWNPTLLPKLSTVDAQPVDTSVPHNSCELLWEGNVLRPVFKSFRFESFDLPSKARAYLAQRQLGHLFDHAVGVVALEAQEAAPVLAPVATEPVAMEL